MKNRKDVFNLRFFKNLEVTGDFDSPVIRKNLNIPTNLISFNYALSCKDPEKYYVHFYIDDYQFERIWHKPTKYISLLKKFAGVIGPDFSAYTDMSISQRIFNIYRNKVLTACWQKLGLNVIPNGRWIENNKIYNFNNGFDGLPHHSSIAITTNSTQSSEKYEKFQIEFQDILNKLEPTNVIVYGRLKEREKFLCQQQGVNVFEFKRILDKMEDNKNVQRKK